MPSHPVPDRSVIPSSQSRSRSRRVTLSVAGAGVAVALAALSACGSSSTSSHAASSSGKNRLDIIMWNNPPAISFVQSLDKEFAKKYPNISVQMQHADQPSGAYSTLQDTQLAAKTVDIYAEFAPAPIVQPPKSTHIVPSGQTALIEGNTLVNLANQPFMKYYSKSAEQLGNGWHGGVYGLTVAQYANDGNTWANDALLHKYHVSLPTTFNQLISDCKLFKAHNVNCLFGDSSSPSRVFSGIYAQLLMEHKTPNQMVSTILAQDRGFLKGTENYDSPLFQQAAKQYAELMQYMEPNSSGVSFDTSGQVWAQKEYTTSAFMVADSAGGLQIHQYNPKLAYTGFTLPGTNDPTANRETTNLDLTWYVPKTAPDKSAAMKWLSLLSQPSNYARFLKTNGSVSLQPAQKTVDPWMTWYNSHLSGQLVIPSLTPWVPAGASPQASGPWANNTNSTDPVLDQMVPLGSTSISSELSSIAKTYDQTLKIKSH